MNWTLFYEAGSRESRSHFTEYWPSGPRPCGKLLLTKDTINYSMFRQTDRDTNREREFAGGVQEIE